MAFGAGVSKGQVGKIYASSTPTPAGSGVTNPTNCISPGSSIQPSAVTKTAITATGTSGLFGLLGSDVSTSITLKFTSTIPLNNVVFVKVLNLNTTNGSTVAFDSYNGAVKTANSASYAFSDNLGGTYYAVYDPLLTFDRIVITVTGKGSTLLTAAGTASMEIDYAFYIPIPSITASPASTVCSGSQATLTVNPTVAGLTYKWYTSSTATDPVNTGTSYSPYVSSTTTYYVEAIETATTLKSGRTPVKITVNPLPSLVATTPSKTIATGATASLSVVAAAGSDVEWYDDAGTKVSIISSYTTPAFSSAGTHNYNVIATNPTTRCTNSTTITVTVYEPSGCSSLTERVYANSQTYTNNVITPTFGADGDPKTSSTLTPVLDLLGLFAPTQTLFFPNEVAAGTPAVVKLGPGIGVLSLISGITVVGVTGNASSYTEIGTPQSVNVSLLNLLSGENTFEFPVVPSNGTGPKKYNGIKIVFSSTLSLGTTLNVFDAYFTRPATTIADCTKKDVIDVLAGAVAPAGVSAVTTAVNVVNPWLAVDGDEATYATINNTVSLLAYAKETIVFSSPSMPGVSVGDSLKLIVSKGGTLLGLDLLTQFKIQRYLGSSAVGDPLDNSSTFLSISLLSGGTKAAIIIKPTPEPYDRVEIQVGGVATVLGTLYLHEVQRTATIAITGGTTNTSTTVCKGTDVTINAPGNACTTYKWYTTATGTTEVPTTNNGQTLSTSALTAGTNVFYVQPIRFGCGTLTRTKITVVVNDLATTSNAGATQNLCSTTTATLDGNVPTVGAGSWSLVSGPAGSGFTDNTAAKSGLTGLVPGSYVFKWTITSTCGTNSTNVTINVSNPPAPPTVPGQAVCYGFGTTLSVSSPDANLTYKWYSVASAGTSFNTGTSYATGALTSNTDYYVEAYNATTTCTSTRTKVTVTINALPIAPLAAAPAICSGTPGVFVVTNPIGGLDYRWYTSATGGSPEYTGISFTTSSSLTSDTDYYVEAYNTTTTCVSTTRTKVSITVNPLPIVNQISGPSKVCIGQSINLSNTTPLGVWASGSPGKATVSSTGVVTGLAAGSTTITYTVTTAADCSFAVVKIIDIIDLPNASISGNTTVCQNATSPVITFTGSNGIAPYTFTYNINGAGTFTSTTATGNSVDVSVLTTSPGIYSYNLISVKDSNSTQCPRTLNGTATVTVVQKPTSPHIISQ